jgi:RimJ/RimL family protein N-acetyltransferase
MIRLSIGALTLAQFQPADAQALYDIRNHTSVRAFMANTEPLQWDRHLAWVEANLLTGERLLLFMVRLADAPLGFTLLKRLTADTAEVGLVLREAHRHRLIVSEAGAATVHVAFEVLGLTRLVSYVVPSHAQAIAFNTRTGGVEVPSDKPGMLQFEFQRAGYLSNRYYQRTFARIERKLSVVME